MAAGSPPDSASRTRGTASTSLAWAGLALIIVAGLGFYWGFDALPFQDLPAHAGLIALRQRLGQGGFEGHFYVAHPHLGPYSLFRGLGDLTARVVGPVGAVRALATLPLLALPSALAVARARLHADRSPAGAYFGVTLTYGLMTLFGFAGFELAIAVLVVTLTLALQVFARADAGSPTLRGEVATAAFASALVLAHGYAYCVFVLVVVVAAFAAGARRGRLVCLRMLAPSAAVAVVAAWAARGTGIASPMAPGRAGPLLRFQGPLDKLSLLVTPTLLTRTGVDIAVGLVVWAALVTAAVASRRRGGDSLSPSPSADHGRALYAGALALLVAFALLPHEVGWFGFVDGRLVPLVLVLAVMAYRRPQAGAAGAFVSAAAPAAAVAMTGIALLASRAFQEEAKGYRDVLGLVAGGHTLLNLPLDPDSRVFTAHPFVHYDKLVMASRPVVVSDLWFHQGSAVFPTLENPALRLPGSYRESDLGAIDWPSYRLDDWDYVLVRTQPGSEPPAVPPRLSLLRHEGGFWLYASALQLR